MKRMTINLSLILNQLEESSLITSPGITESLNASLKRRSFLKLFLVMAALLYGQDVWANKATTSIEAPENIGKGSEVIIRVTVTHSANNFMHHIKWLQIIINGKEIARWDYTMGNRPEGAIFTKEIKYKVEGDIEIKAEASCNTHGSAGPSAARVLVKK